MITEKPDVKPDGLYTQKQAADALQINRHTIYRYEHRCCIKFRVRKSDNRKVCTGAEIIKCWRQVYL